MGRLAREMRWHCTHTRVDRSFFRLFPNVRVHTGNFLEAGRCLSLVFLEGKRRTTRVAQSWRGKERRLSLKLKKAHVYYS